jgi:RNA polymerase sigma factor (sigma-70 family)
MTFMDETNVDDPYDDAVVVERCLAGDSQAWESLLNHYGRLIYTIPLRFGFPKPVADEVFQEVCLTILKKLGMVQDPQRLHAWLVTVTRRVCIERLRQNPTPPINLDDDELGELVDTDLEDYQQLFEHKDLLQRAMNQLDLPCQSLLQALFFDETDSSYQAAAARLGMPLGSIGPRRARCLESLRRIIALLDADVASKH